MTTTASPMIRCELSALEAATRLLFDRREHQLGMDGWNHDERLVGKVFKAMWAQSLSLDRATAIAVAIGGFAPGVKLDLQPALTSLCRAKVLRSRMASGCRVWEVNY